MQIRIYEAVSRNKHIIYASKLFFSDHYYLSQRRYSAKSEQPS